MSNGRQAVATRYTWRKSADNPERLELYDLAARCVIAEIVQAGRKSHWRRNTSALLHGALPANGTADSLGDAKRAIASGLPDAPTE